MGELAEDAADGTACCLCGCYFKGQKEDELYTHEYPAVCWNCWRDLSKKQRKQYQRALQPTI